MPVPQTNPFGDIAVKNVTLVQPHTHAGKKYEPGTVLALTDRDADWLVEAKVAKAGGTNPANAEKTTDQPK